MFPKFSLQMHIIGVVMALICPLRQVLYVVADSFSEMS